MHIEPLATHVTRTRTTLTLLLALIGLLLAPRSVVASPVIYDFQFGDGSQLTFPFDTANLAGAAYAISPTVETIAGINVTRVFFETSCGSFLMFTLTQTATPIPCGVQFNGSPTIWLPLGTEGPAGTFTWSGSFSFLGAANVGSARLTISTPSLVPEPATMSLVGLGIAGLVAHRRRRPARA